MPHLVLSHIHLNTDAARGEDTSQGITRTTRNETLHWPQAAAVARKTGRDISNGGLQMSLGLLGDDDWQGRERRQAGPSEERGAGRPAARAGRGATPATPGCPLPYRRRPRPHHDRLIAMTTLSAAGFFNAEITNQQAKDAQDGILAVLRELPGGGAEETRTIANGAITPQRAVVAIDTEDQAPADDLDVVNTTHHPPGRLLLLRAVDQGRPVTVRHAQGGPGQIHLAAGEPITLQQPETWLLLLRRGEIWHEVLRAYGADRAAARSFLELWSRDEADARFARLAEPNVFTRDQTVQHADGDATSFLIKRGAVDLTVLAAASEGRLGTLSNHDLLLLRQDQAKVTIQSNRVEFADHVETSGRFRVLGAVRTELRSGASNGILETGTDHNLIIRRNIAHIELRGDNTTDFKQPITRQNNAVWDDGDAPPSPSRPPAGWCRRRIAAPTRSSGARAI